MRLFPFILILISVISHAYWNFLVKQADDKEVFVSLCKMTEAVLFLIPFIILSTYYGIDLSNWYYIVGASIFVFLNYYLLTKAYQHLELSIAYPVSRTSTLFIPFIAYLAIGETIDILGAISVITVTLGVFFIHRINNRPSEVRKFVKIISKPTLLYPIFAAFTVAAYTVWDKIAIRNIHPFIYFYLYTFLVALFFGFKTFITNGSMVIRNTWRSSRGQILQVAFLNTFTYILVLIALKLSKATYVGALRQLSLIVGLFLGIKYLNESITRLKITGIILILCGGIITLFAN